MDLLPLVIHLKLYYQNKFDLTFYILSLLFIINPLFQRFYLSAVISAFLQILFDFETYCRNNASDNCFLCKGQYKFSIYLNLINHTKITATNNIEVFIVAVINILKFISINYFMLFQSLSFQVLLISIQYFLQILALYS